LARILSSFEFGFASALSASYSTFELVTDIAIHRFVLASARTEYEQALAAAHGLSIVRGAAAGLLACAAAPGFAYMMSVPADWTSFAWLGLAVFIRSFEHFELRVAERDYRYRGQLLMNLVANSTALAVMIATWFYIHDHTVYIAMLFAQNISYVLASHCFARTPYRPEFRSAYFRSAARFAFPLVLSGIGLAVVSQGDRLLVGSVLDVSTLGIYSVFILTITVPAAAITQICSSLALAGLHNAVADPERTRRRLQLYMRAMLILGVCFAFGLLAFMNIIVPFVFGPRFTATKGIVALLAAVSFLSVSRAEPTTSVLLINHRTRALAALSLSGGLGLFAATVLAVSYRNLYTVLFGRLIGEMFGFGITMALLRRYLGNFAWPSFFASGWAGSWIAAAIVLDMAYALPDTSLLRLGILASLAMLSIGGLAFNLRSMVERAYS
jgi:O-antigen/teichoic acid export membrane protein